ncbi:hypothetical protein [Actinomadura hibisca]|uniref:hypothetical protein n=1 Tax=Actinomadura hibisca TaxID=68565 RepID=UPI00082F19F5|nr:hypothetical protein [Actinomadura hibisca]
MAGLAAPVQRVATALSGAMPPGRLPAGPVPPSGGVLTGCLQDAVVDHGRFRVVSVRHAG